MNEIDQAVKILRAGGLVAFPTETVYGLGADAANPSAVAKIFAVKGRPANNPLIVHVADVAGARKCAAEWPAAADRLAARFWPGPLTIVVLRNRSGKNVVADAVAAGGNTVAIRAPDHPVAQKLLRAFAGPVAAPSANRSSHISPTTAGHVRDDLGDRVDFILDGGPCRVGIESTVLDLTGPPTILRPGQIGREELEAALAGPVRIARAGHPGPLPARSPGQLDVHYAPHLPTYRFDRVDRPAMEASTDPRRKLMLRGGDQPMSLPRRWIMPTDPAAYAAELYRVLREMDASNGGEEEIWIEMPPDSPAWAAVRNRLLRASRPAKH
jgi:L-threonylcarbamoyladenylate synthase